MKMHVFVFSAPRVLPPKETLFYVSLAILRCPLSLVFDPHFLLGVWFVLGSYGDMPGALY
jgi:hypothetical protein